MIKDYNFKGINFKTIKIPKGTILFRGINVDKSKSYDQLFSELIGYRSKKGKYFEIAPSLNTFFYPVPYVSDSVKIYDIHIMYITQYDLELFLLLKPSHITLNNSTNPIYKDIFQICNDISSHDKCGFEMSSYDPCFTEPFLERFSHIDGYIGINEEDARYFLHKYKSIVNNPKYSNRISYIITALLSNNKQNISIPEIVIHPLRFRHDTCFKIKDKIQFPDQIINYCLQYRAQYNFFPFLYFTNINVYTITHFKDIELIKQIIKINRILDDKEPKIYTFIDDVFKQLLSPSGYLINNIVYKAGINPKLGMYKMYINNSNNKTIKNITQKRNKSTLKFKDDIFEGLIDTVINYKQDTHVDKIINDIEPHDAYLDSFLYNLTMSNYNPKKKLIVDRGNKNKLIYNYNIDKVFDRPELNHHRQIRKIKQNKSRKNIYNKMKFILNNDELLEVSNIESE